MSVVRSSALLALGSSTTDCHLASPVLADRSASYAEHCVTFSRKYYLPGGVAALKIRLNDPYSNYIGQGVDASEADSQRGYFSTAQAASPIRTTIPKAPPTINQIDAAAPEIITLTLHTNPTGTGHPLWAIACKATPYPPEKGCLGMV